MNLYQLNVRCWWVICMISKPAAGQQRKRTHTHTHRCVSCLYAYRLYVVLWVIWKIYAITSNWLIAIVAFICIGDDFAKRFHFRFLLHLRSIALRSVAVFFTHGVSYFFFARETKPNLSINGVTVFFDIVCMHAHIFSVPLGFSRDLCSVRNCFSTFKFRLSFLLCVCVVMAVAYTFMYLCKCLCIYILLSVVIDDCQNMKIKWKCKTKSHT